MEGHGEAYSTLSLKRADGDGSSIRWERLMVIDNINQPSRRVDRTALERFFTRHHS
jgi:hypothetical protein